MIDPTECLPEPLRMHVREILMTKVKGGSARYQKNGDRSGSIGQREISKLLQEAGISKNDPRWIAINRYGRCLYEGKPVVSNAFAQQTTPGIQAIDKTIADDLGKVYSRGNSFRARAEALQRHFRANVLKAGWEQWGHLLDQSAIQQGMNFLHPVAREMAERRETAGKGVHRSRTFGNMLSSQAMCFNIFGPLAATAEGLALAGQVLAGFVPGLIRVHSIEIEHTPPFEIFHDQSGHAGVDCDVLIDFEDSAGVRGVLVIETKFVEDSFSCCGHRKDGKSDPCPLDVRIGSDFSGCRYISRNRFLYWQRAAETRSLRLPLAEDRGCPFGGPLWQIWVNHTLAHAIAASRGAGRAVFAVCASSQNEELLEGGALLDQFRKLATNPSSVAFLPLEELLSRLAAATATHPAFCSWAAMLQQRYTVPMKLQSSPTTVDVCPRGILTDGHRRVLRWMATPAFREAVAAHRVACGNRATIYFRPTDKGIVRIALCKDAPGYVGFRTSASDDESYFLDLYRLPGIEELRSGMNAFESWLPTVNRYSNEEQGVIPWMRRALDSDLSLPDLGRGWVFLHQEWRWISEGTRGKRSDILAVHIPSGQLGIIEFKDDKSKLPEAVAQVGEYAEFWNHDAKELAPFFTTLARAMGTAYNNDEMSQVSVAPLPAKLFMGVASFRHGVQVWPC